MVAFDMTFIVSVLKQYMADLNFIFFFIRTSDCLKFQKRLNRKLVCMQEAALIKRWELF